MGNSLQDQLLKAGLVDAKQLKKVKNDKRKTNKQLHKSKTETVDQNKLQVQQALTEKAKRDRQLNRQLKDEAERKAIAAQIQQLIEKNRLPKGDGDVPYNFADNNKIKRIFVSAAVQEQLSRGKLAIVKLNENYELVPIAIAERIRMRDEKCVILCNDPQQGDEQQDEPYANYQVPDDLMW